MELTWAVPREPVALLPPPSCTVPFARSAVLPPRPDRRTGTVRTIDPSTLPVFTLGVLPVEPTCAVPTGRYGLKIVNVGEAVRPRHPNRHFCGRRLERRSRGPITARRS